MLNLTIEKFASNPNYHYLLLNGYVIAAITPSDIETIVKAIPTNPDSQKFVHQTIEDFYKPQPRGFLGER